jgi:hypothetical protein
MAGVRHLQGAKEPIYHVNGMGCNGYLGRNWVPAVRAPHFMERVEGFQSNSSFSNLILMIIILVIIVALAAYFLNEKKHQSF